MGDTLSSEEIRKMAQAKELLALKDAIKHCSEVENSCVGVMCSLEHKQLRIWLTELLELKQKQYGSHR